MWESLMWGQPFCGSGFSRDPMWGLKPLLQGSHPAGYDPQNANQNPRMARIIPADLTRAALAGAKKPEIETLALLKDELPDDYTVFHGVHWTREYQAWTHFGEIDFIVINQAGRVLLIEQKNGPLVEANGTLVKAYDDRDKNIAEQVGRSLDKVREKFRRQSRREHALDMDYLVYLPDYRVRNINAVGLDTERIVDASTHADLAARIGQLLGPGRRDAACFDRVFDFFCQTCELVPDLHAHVGAHEKAWVRHAGALVSVLENLEMTPFRLRVHGTAGSGKSLLAGRFLARQAAAGRRALAVCFNRPLAERRRATARGHGHVDTFHGFCRAFLASRGQPLDFSQADGNPHFWREVQERVTGEIIPEGWRFDALVVDEGQDFEQEWFETLKLFLADGAEILWLEDPDQNLLGRPPVVTESFVGYRALINYRTPDSIARHIRQSLPFRFEPGNDLPGLGVGEHRCDGHDEQARIVTQILQRLTRGGFRYEDIVVLSCHGISNSAFSEAAQIGGAKLRRFTGEYDAQGNQVLSDGRLTFDSVYRFKGQEAPAVILVDVDPPPQSPEKLLRWQRVLYCAMTRATVRLDVVGD